MDYASVSAELKRGTPAELICATCPWHRPCVAPPPMTEAELTRKLDEARKADERERPGAFPAHTLLTAAVAGGQTSSGAQCPVFALRLGGPDGRKYADGIREIMRTAQ